MRIERLVFIGVVIIVLTCSVIVLTANANTPFGYFAWGVAGGQLLWFAVMNLLGLRQSAKDEDQLQRLTRQVNSAKKHIAPGHTDAYNLGYDMALCHVQNMLRKEWRNLK